MRIVFLGAGAFGLPTLQRLHAAHEVALVVSQPDRPAGRKRRLTPTPISAWADAEPGLITLKTENANAASVLERVGDLEPDAMVIVAFGQYLKQALVAIPRLGAMNLHASLLPRWRGAAPISAAILHGETETGNTAIRIAKRMDAGDILGAQRTPIDPLETAGELHDRLAAMGPDLVLDVLDRLDRGVLEPMAQDEERATLAPKLSKADGWIDFTDDAPTIRCRVHGLTPWPGVRAWWSSEGQAARQPLTLKRVQDLPAFEAGAGPGVLVDAAQGIVAAGRGAVKLLEVQAPGRKALEWRAFTQGHPLPEGTRFHRDETD